MAIIPKYKKGKKKDSSADTSTDTNTETGGSSPGGASTGGVGSGLGGAGTGGAATGGASTGGAGTVNVTISGNSGTGSNEGGSGKKKSGGKGKPTTINISNVGGKTDAGSTQSGDGPGASGSGGTAPNGFGGGGGGASPDEPANFSTQGKDGDKMKSKGNLATAYAVKSKAKKMAKGGSVSASDEKRPMPENTYDDAKTVSHNSGNKASVDDSWGSDKTVRQSQKPSITKLSRPKMVGSDAFSVRSRDMRDDEADMTNRIHPESDLAQPVKRDDEVGPNRQGTKVPDMAAQHKNKKAPYIKEIEDQYAQDMADANMKKVQSYAKGGAVMEPKDNHDELEERTDEGDMQKNLSSTEHGEQPAKWRDEEDADGSGDDVPALHMKMMADGGEVYGSGLSKHEWHKAKYEEHSERADANKHRLPGFSEETNANRASLYKHHSNLANKHKDMAEKSKPKFADGGPIDPKGVAEGARQGGSLSDAWEGLTHPKWAEGGEVTERASELDSQEPITDRVYHSEEEALDHASSIVAAVMARRKKFADGGQVDIDNNNKEEPNGYYEANEDSALKENYNDGFKFMSQLEDSNEDGREISADPHEKDMLAEIRNKMKRRLK